VGTLLFGIFAACAPQSPQSESPNIQQKIVHHPTADFVLLNGKISTMDPEIGEVTALAIVNDRIKFAGTDDKARAWIGNTTHISRNFLWLPFM